MTHDTRDETRSFEPADRGEPHRDREFAERVTAAARGIIRPRAVSRETYQKPLG